MVSAYIQHIIESPWIELEPVRVGKIPPGLGTPDRYVIVAVDNKPYLRVDVYGDGSNEMFAFEEVIIWNQWVVIGFGHKVYLVPLDTGHPKTIELESYFCHLYPNAKWLLATSGQQLFCIGSDGNAKWSTEPLGIDGVLIERMDNQFAYGKGEWDPPGDWQPFQVDLETGRLA